MSHNRARTARRAAERSTGLPDVTENAPVVVEEKPEPFAKGKYALYELPSGDGLLVYRPEEAEEDNHQVIPGGIWKIFMALMRGEKPNVNPMMLMKAMMGQ